MSDAPAIDTWGFKRGALIYPQPVASACGRVLRASNAQEQIDACLKGAEILARYLSALALSSLSGRDVEAFPEAVKPLEDDLSFGDYLTLVQAVSKSTDHPLFPHLGPFRPRGEGKNRNPGKADAHMVALLELRNQIGHALASMSKARAITILNKEKPAERLLEAFKPLEGILSLPLFVLDNIRLKGRRPVAQRLLLMGENPDPIPEDVELSQALDAQTPYVAIDNRVLALPPVVLFELIEEQAAYRLAFLDSVNAKKEKLRFKTLESWILEKPQERYADLHALFGGQLRPPEELAHADGQTFHQEWSLVRSSRETAGKHVEGRVPWSAYAGSSLEWYAKRLPSGESDSPSVAITKALLDGRSRGWDEGELNQLTLLFGTEREVRSVLGRDLYDFRAVSEPGARWDERVSGSQNILDTLKTGIDFFAKHVGIDSEEADDLTKTEGSADYIAMREALVNQFIHQDYADKSAAAQVELTPGHASFFNTGHSLVTSEHLTKGGKSQARNPLIARALRLIGYAELAGSGILALQYEWRKAKRRPPIMESDRVGNTFSLTLDWAAVPDAYDQVWKKKLGVRLTDSQAAILNLATDAAGITVHQAAAGTGCKLAEAQEALRFLVHQVLWKNRTDAST
jgi:hypothetical protein